MFYVVQHTRVWLPCSERTTALESRSDDWFARFKGFILAANAAADRRTLNAAMTVLGGALLRPSLIGFSVSSDVTCATEVSNYFQSTFKFNSCLFVVIYTEYIDS